MALIFRFGVPESFVRPTPEGGLLVGVSCPVVGTVSEECWPLGVPSSAPEKSDGGWIFSRTRDFQIAAAAVVVTDETVEATTHRLYKALFAATVGRHLYRIWHFLPRITERTPGALENYQKFCRARACAFEAAYALAPELRMPAASAVGVSGSVLVIVAIAGDVAPEHFENPEQVPAYRYPARYGPKSPSFARASKVVFRETTWCFISGTAAIKGSESMFPGDVSGQAQVTADNLRLISAVAARGLRPDRVFARCYLSEGVSSPDEATALPESVRGSAVTMRANVCRPELLLECELSILHSRDSEAATDSLMR